MNTSESPSASVSPTQEQNYFSLRTQAVQGEMADFVTDFVVVPEFIKHTTQQIWDYAQANNAELLDQGTGPNRVMVKFFLEKEERAYTFEELEEEIIRQEKKMAEFIEKDQFEAVIEALNEGKTRTADMRIAQARRGHIKLDLTAMEIKVACQTGLNYLQNLGETEKAQKLVAWVKENGIVI